MAAMQNCITMAETDALSSDVVLTECMWRHAGVGVTTEPAGSPWAEWGDSAQHAEQDLADLDFSPPYLLTGTL